MSDENGYSLVIRFPDQSASFAHGFEAGALDARLRDAARIGAEALDTATGFPIHSANEDLVIALAKRHGFTAIISPCTDETGADYAEWTNVRFEKAKP